MPQKRKREPETIEINLDLDRKILVAVDFGTTFSGIAWTQTRKPDLQSIVIQWPDARSGGLEGVTCDKVPSEIQYIGKEYKWGFQISEHAQRHQWFKLELDPAKCHSSPRLTKFLHDPVPKVTSNDVPTDKIITDYLTALREHFEKVICHKLPGSAVQSTPMEYIITVPAVWSDCAQARTLSCAEKAGMGTNSTLQIVSEPEAAATYALDIMDPHNIKKGDTFVLCDAGGGTVDLISYTVSALKPRLEVIEASPGNGSICGSSILNRIFQDFLVQKLGHQPGWDDEVLEEAMKRFDVIIKRQFGGTAAEDFFVPVPGLHDNAQLNIRRGRLRVTDAEVQKVFDPVVQEVVRLVLGQIIATQKSVKAVLLVGGFGQNAYLRECIRVAVGKRVEVMQSPNGWTAVVRGALMKALAGTLPRVATVKVTGRSARKHYGIQCEVDFVPRQHDLKRRFWSGNECKHRVDTMDWFIKKGTIIRENKPVRLQYHQTRLKSTGRPKSAIVIIRYFVDPDNEGAPLYHDSPGVTELVRIEADLSRIPAPNFPQETGSDGKDYYVVEFYLQITHYSATTEYELIHDGINYGKVAAEYV